MKITDVTLVMRSRSLPNPLGPPTLELGVLSIVTDEGIVGETFVGTSPARPPVFLSIGCSGPAGNQCRATPRHGSIPMCPRTPRKRWRIAIKGFRHTSCTHPPSVGFFKVRTCRWPMTSPPAQPFELRWATTTSSCSTLPGPTTMPRRSPSVRRSKTSGTTGMKIRSRPTTSTATSVSRSGCTSRSWPPR